MVSVGGVRGVLEFSDGSWVVANEAEVRLLEALCGERGALGRLRALAATLDAGLVEPGEVRWLNERLSVIAAVEPERLWRVHVPADLYGAAAFASASVNDESLSRWLGNALAARLDPNLVQGLLPGAGWWSWQVPHHHRRRTFDRETHWMSEMPPVFWERLRAHPDPRLAAVAEASDPAAPRKTLESLADDWDDLEVTDLLAANPNTPARMLRRLAQPSIGFGRPELRAAQNHRATAALLGVLARSSDREVRYVAAWHPNVPVSALRRLCGDESSLVRSAVAHAEAAPTRVLETLAEDPDVWVRRNVAANPSTPRQVLEALLGDRFAAVRAAAAANPHTPQQAVAAYVSDRAKRVRAAVAARPIGADALAVLADDPKWEVRQGVAHNEQTPPQVLERLAADDCGEVRAAVAFHPHTPPGALKALAGDGYWWVRHCLASNTSTPAETLLALTGDEDPDVSGSAAQNSAMPRSELDTLAAHEDYAVRAGVALHPRVSARLLRKLAGDDDRDVRRCVCHNHRTPEAVLDTLSSDDDYWVRAASAAETGRRRTHTAASGRRRNRAPADAPASTPASTAAGAATAHNAR